MATPAPTPTFSPAFLAQDVTSSVLAAAIPTFALATIGVTLRIFARRLTAAKFWWDDYLIFISYILAAGVMTVIMLLLRFGVGNHVEVVEPVNPNGIIGILKLTVPGELLYTLSICFAKLSVLSFYWRIFGVTQMRKVLIVLIVVVICWAVSVIVVSAVTCVPMEALWNPLIEGKCIDLAKFLIAISFPNVITDWIMLAVPLSHIWGLHMPMSQKMVVMSLFVVGGFVCIVSLVRLIFISHLDFTDVTWGMVPLGVWTSVENFSAVFCACLPSLKPIYNLVVGKPLNTTAHSAATSNTYSKSKSKASKGLWSTSNDSSKPESFTRLRDEEDWSNTSATANKGTANVYLEPMELNNVDR